MQKLSTNRDALDNNHVLLLTTNSNERRAMLKMLDGYKPLATGSQKQRAFLGHSNGSLVVVLDGDGGFSSEDAATRFAISYLNDSKHPTPSLVLIGGVCWGNPNQVEVGDVIVCSGIESANRSTARTDGNEIKFYRFNSSIDLANLVASIQPKPRCGDLISLEVRLSDESARDELLKQKSTVLGGEMEAFALVPECRNLPWLVVKAVSDFATAIEGREEQPDAACRAAAVVKSLLESFQTTRQSDLQEQTRTAATNLVHALNGKIVYIRIDQFHPSEQKFTSTLQDLHANQILTSTTIHTNAVAVAPRLAGDITSLLLEIASNAFRHGRARNASIEFRFDGIMYKDDATTFDLATLCSGQGRGGQAAYKKFYSSHMNSGLVTIKSSTLPTGGNRIFICVSHEIADLPNIFNQCRVEFDFTKSHRQPSLTWPTKCETAFVDLDRLSMMSVIFDVCDEITAPVNSGVNFVLHCTNPFKIDAIFSRYYNAIQSGQIRLIPDPQLDGK